MSASIHLYKIVEGVDFVSGKCFENHFSDGQVHEVLPIYFDKKDRSHRVRKYYRYMKENFADHICKVKNAGYTENLLPVDEICYAQGWMFSKEFFKKENPLFFAFSKEEMIRLLDCYLRREHLVEINNTSARLSGDYDSKVLDEYGYMHYYKKEYYDIEAIKKKFVEIYDKNLDGKLIFEISW